MAVVGWPRHEQPLKCFGVRRPRPLAGKAKARAIGTAEYISISDYAITAESFGWAVLVTHPLSISTAKSLAQSNEKIGRFGLGYYGLQHNDFGAIIEDWGKGQRVRGEFQPRDYFSNKGEPLSKILNADVRITNYILEFWSCFWRYNRHVVSAFYFADPQIWSHSGFRYLDSIACSVRGYFGRDRGFANFGEGTLSELCLTPSSLEKTQGNESVDPGNDQDSPICNRRPLIPFLLGCLFFSGGCWLNYFYWGWLDDDCRRLGPICGLIFSGCGSSKPGPARARMSPPLRPWRCPSFRRASYRKSGTRAVI